MRSIHINNEIYFYKIGDFNVKVKLPNHNSICLSLAEITGINWDDIERNKWKGNFFSKPSTN